MTNQKDAFLSGEGDAYFSRNRNATPDTPIISFFRPYIEPGFKVFEIGCSDGAKLQAMIDGKGAEGYGIDPSTAAVSNALPGLQLKVGTADALEYEDNTFDLVTFGFCLYLVDRSLLMRAIAEADRVTKPGSFIGIWDFDPSAPINREYRHLQGITTHKMDYSKLFLAKLGYSFVAKAPMRHEGASFRVTRRCAWRVSFCAKSLPYEIKKPRL